MQTFTTAIAPDNIVQRPGRRDESSSDDEYRRFRVTIKHVAEIDLERVMEFCRADKQAPHGEEECLTGELSASVKSREHRWFPGNRWSELTNAGLMATNVLMRDVPSKRYAQVGATGNRFFTLEGAVSILQGAIVCRGFMQWVLAQLTVRVTVRSNACRGLARISADRPRSFRCSNSGLPLLNLDIGFSAFLASGPALEVVAKILGRDRGGGAGPRSGPWGRYTGGPNRQDISELSPGEIGIIKNKLRGAKVSSRCCQLKSGHDSGAMVSPRADFRL